MALVAIGRGDYARAMALCHEFLPLLRDAGDRWQMSIYLTVAAAAAFWSGQPAQCARLHGAVEALREAVGTSLPAPYAAEYGRGVVTLRTALGEEAFAAAWEAGRALTPEEAIAEALAVAADAAAAADAAQVPAR
jgi:hypothetical protein